MEKDRGIQVVRRSRPRPIIYFRGYTYHPPSKHQIEARVNFGRAAEEAEKLSVEEVAKLIGARVYDRERQLVLYRGDVLPKAAAYIKWKLRDKKYAPPKTQLEKLVEIIERIYPELTREVKTALREIVERSKA